MGIKIGIIGGSGLDNLNIFTNARDTFTGTVWGEPSSPLREGEIAGIPMGRIGRVMDAPYDCALFSQLPG